MNVSLLQELGTPIIIFFVALFIRAVFAFLETSITAMRLFKLKELARTTGRYESLFTSLERAPHRVLITTLITSSVADVTSAALATHIMETVFTHFNLSGGLGFSLGVGVASVMLILFGEIIPKNLARGKGERIFKSMLWLINLVYYTLSPLVSTLIGISDAFTHRFADKDSSDKGGWAASEKEIRFLIEYIHDKGLMEAEKTEMLRNIFDLGATPVREILVPATDIISIEVETPINRVLEVFAEHQFTRLPVYKKAPENIVGMIHQKDIFVMLSRNEDKPLKDLVRPIMFIPESIKVNQLLREFRQQQMHIAIVLNEHGSMTGLITLEDVLEEIVGEISDEHEPASEKIVPLKQGGWLVDASITLEELGGFLQMSFETESSITLGGFLTEQLQHLPKKGERIVYKELYFQVQKASPKRVREVLIFEKKGNQPPEE